MARCSRCGGRAVIRAKLSGELLCRNCFEEYFLSVTKRALSERPGLEALNGSRVLVALSGGKDSLNALYVLVALGEELGLEVEAVAVDEGISGYRDVALRAARDTSGRLGVRCAAVSFEDEYGFTVDDAARAYFSGAIGYKPCTVCGVLKRHLINRLALEMGADFVATGHNMDDEVQTLVINVLRGDLRGIAKEGAAASRVEGLVPRIKPLYYVTDRESLAFALLHGFRPSPSECPYVRLSLRYRVRLAINEMESAEPGLKLRLLRLKEELQRELSAAASVELRRCPYCGQPTPRDICRACHILREVRGAIRLS